MNYPNTQNADAGLHIYLPSKSAPFLTFIKLFHAAEYKAMAYILCNINPHLSPLFLLTHG